MSILTIQCHKSGIEELVSWPEHAQFYGFYDPDDLSTLPPTISQLDKYISAEGPFDALLGFSAGAVLAGLYMAKKQQQRQTIPLKCGIFVASADIVQEAAYLGLTDVGSLCIPTVHIWGANDSTAPTGGPAMTRMFDAATSHTLVHDGGHEFPKKQQLTDAAHSIRRAFALALQG